MFMGVCMYVYIKPEASVCIVSVCVSHSQYFQRDYVTHNYLHETKGTVLTC